MELMTVHTKLVAKELDCSLLPAGGAFPYLTAMSILTRVSGVPLAASRLNGEGFSRRYPKSTIPEEARVYFKSDVSTYNSWRNLILDVTFLADPGIVDHDPWETLQRAARICRGRAFASRLYHVRSRVGSGILPWELDRKQAVDIDARLSGQDRLSFRQGLGAMDALQKEELALRARVLPAVPLGKLPKSSDHFAEFPIPSSLEEFWNAASDTDRNALAFVWRMGVMAGIFSLSDNPRPDDFFAAGRGAVFLELDPGDFGLRRPSKNTYRVYLQRLSFRLSSQGGMALPDEHSDVEKKWLELRDLARSQPGLSAARIGNLAAISTPAIRDGIPPADLDPNWIVARLAELPAQKGRAFRSACYTINELSDAHGTESGLLPIEGTGVVRQRVRNRST